MALIKEVRGFKPTWGETCWLAETAVIIGDVTMGEDCSIWFNAVIRGDVNSIIIGNNTNIQDNATIHGTYEKASTSIGNNVSVGHNAIVHGCTLEDDVLVGMGSIIMDNAIVQKGAMVAAGAVVLANTIVETNTIYAGVPAKKVKDIDPENRAMTERIAGNYNKYASWFK